MNLSRRQAQWDELANRDPFWTILASPGKAGNRWETEEFFRTGIAEIERAIQRISKLPVKQPHIRALDFGCGVGRLTQALSTHFERVDGVDISPTMVELANKFNRYKETCHYHVNGADNLALFGADSFDFIYSRLVLQHIPPRITRRYLREFVRVLRPGGVLLFQLPAGPVNRALRVFPQGLLDGTFNLTRNSYRRLFRIRPLGWEMHWIPRPKVEQVLTESGGTLLRIDADDLVEGKLTNLDYVVTKPG